MKAEIFSGTYNEVESGINFWLKNNEAEIFNITQSQHGEIVTISIF